MRKTLEKIYMALILIFMYLPIAVMIVLSFNSSKSRTVWGGFTFKWYVSLFQDSTILNALANTLLIALISTLAATFIGTLTCVAMSGMKRPGRAFFTGVSNIPMINADIVTGISLMLLFRALHFDQGFATVLLAHITFNIPYVLLNVWPKMKSLSPSTYEAALDLGASPFLAFRKAVLPELGPSIVAGSLMAFTMSIDDFIITYFTKGAGFDTLSTMIYAQVKRGVHPEIYALSTLLFAAVVTVLLLSGKVRRRSGVPKKSSDYQKQRVKTKILAAAAAAAAGAIVVLGLLYGGVFSDAGNKVYVYNAGDYIDPSVITQFEEETGIEVVYDEFDSNELMYAKLAQDDSAYDVICPSDYMISRLIQEDLIQPLDFDAMPDATQYIGQQYYKSAQAFDPVNQYAVPYCWGTVGILYNTKMVDEPVTSWDILWDPKYSGQILMQDSIRDCLMVALKKDGFSANSTDEAQVAQAAQDLISQRPLVQAYVIDQARDKMIGNEAAMAVIYSGEAIYCARENPDLAYVVPDEGSNVWIDAWCVTKDAKNKENAQAWINFMCRPDIALKNFEYITYSTPNVAAQEEIEDEQIRNSPIAFPDQSVLDRCETFVYLGEKADRMYSDYWKKIKSGS